MPSTRLADLYRYDDGSLIGVVDCTLDLIRESAAAEPTGAVPAYQDGDCGPWTYCPPSRVDDLRRQQIEVITVYVLDVADEATQTYTIESRLAGGEWQPEGSGDEWDTEAAAERAVARLERTEPKNDDGITLEYRVAARG